MDPPIFNKSDFLGSFEILASVNYRSSKIRFFDSGLLGSLKFNVKYVKYLNPISKQFSVTLYYKVSFVNIS